MELKTKRLNIRYIEESDWKRLMEIWQDFNQSEYAKYDGPHTEDEAEVQQKVKRFSEATPYGEHLFFAVCLEAKMIGIVDFHKTPDGYDLGYCFHRNYHGNGYAKESLEALIEWLSKGHKTVFTAGTALNNIPSVKLLTALGFRKTGEEQVSFYQDESGKDIYFTGGIFSLDVN